MASTATILVVGSVPDKHPSGERRRAGKRFTIKPCAHFVTAEELKAIEGDPLIKVHRRLSRGWFLGLDMEFSETNVKKFTDRDPTPAELKGEAVAPSDAGKAPKKADKTSKPSNAKKEDKTAAGAKESQGKPPVKLTMTASKDECIAALKLKGAVEGKDFNPDASRKDLVMLYNSI